MTTGPALPCPKCKRVLEPNSWHGANGGSCWSCRTDFEFAGFPALNAHRERAVPQAAEVAADSVCFFHPENRAETVCEECGRLVCQVCSVPFVGRKLCPACISSSRQSNAEQVVQHRVLFDRIALALAIVPLIVWPVTLVTSCAALGVVIYGWKKPGSLVGGRRVRLVIAAVLAVAEICGWVIFFSFIGFRR